MQPFTRSSLAAACVMLAYGASPAWSQAAAPAAPAAAAPAAEPAPLPPLEAAVLKAANDLFSKVQLPADAGDKVVLVIDPLIDGVTGVQTIESGRVRNRIVALVRSKYPRFDVEQFNTETVAKKPVVLIGTFTPINNAGQARGPRDAYRVCLALADLKSGTLVSKGFAKADPKGVDPTPISFFRDSPVWTSDPATDAYIKSCQGTKTGDPIKPLYVERIQSAAMLSDAIKSYDTGNYKKAHDLYSKASATSGGDQLRVYNGLYLTALRLKKMKEAEEAFGKLVDFGIKNNNLAVKFLFKVDSTDFYPDRNVTHPYDMWVRQISQQAAKDSACLDLVGHASPTGGEAYNDQLSNRRAETIKSMLVKTSNSLSSKLATKGMGFKENLIGTGRDDASDALDRRVEFKVGKCS